MARFSDKRVRLFKGQPIPDGLEATPNLIDPTHVARDLAFRQVHNRKSLREKARREKREAKKNG